MKDPHDINNYEKTDEPVKPQSTDIVDVPTENGETPSPTTPSTDVKPKKIRKEKPPKFSGAYYYVDKDEKSLQQTAFIRTLLTVIAMLLQIVVLMLPQGGLEYVTNRLSSYAFIYMMLVFAMLIIGIWFVIMNMTRYKLIKRIPKEYAPKNGFGKRAFFGNELFIASNAVIAVAELSFVCIHYDGVGLTAFLLCCLATGAAVWARQIVHLTLKDAELIPPPDAKTDEANENKAEK